MHAKHTPMSNATMFTRLSTSRNWTDCSASIVKRCLMCQATSVNA